MTDVAATGYRSRHPRVLYGGRRANDARRGVTRLLRVLTHRELDGTAAARPAPSGARHRPSPQAGRAHAALVRHVREAAARPCVIGGVQRDVQKLEYPLRYGGRGFNRTANAASRG